MTSVAEQFEELCHRAGHDVTNDEVNIIVKDSNTGAVIAIPKMYDSLSDMVHSASKHGVLVNHVWNRNEDMTVGRTTVEVPTSSEYTIEPTSEKQTWFDVIDSDGNIVNEKRLRRADAESLVEELQK